MSERFDIKYGVSVLDWRMSEASKTQMREFLAWWAPAKRKAERGLAIARALQVALPIGLLTGILVALLAH